MGVEVAIRNYLNAHGIKQTFISEQCGWTKQKTNSIINGKRKLTVDEYGAICEVVGVSYDYFYNIVSGVQDSA